MDPELDEQDQLPPAHRRARRVTALVVALFLLAVTVMATGFWLLRKPPHPERTRPLPPVLPVQGAVR